MAMAEFTAASAMKCSHCPYTTASEELMNDHIWKRECPNGSFSYTIYRKVSLA